MENDAKDRCYFIVSCARSGSTSLARILDMAENGVCALEPSPNLNRETREMMEGRCADPMAVVQTTILPRVKASLQDVEIYGEKNVTYGPFIPYLYEMLGCKFVFIKRDGRDTVRSLMDWHNRMFGSIYRECHDPGNLAPRAISAAANLPIHYDTSDYARPRPLLGDQLFSEWDQLSREEMCAHYWAYINDLYLDQLQKLPSDVWIEIDYTKPEINDIIQVFKFLGLTGITQERIQTMLEQKINSLQDRCEEENQYPDWKDWDGESRRRFDRIAAVTMTRLGYYHDDFTTHWKPQRYGEWWCNHETGLDWYTWMYNSRRKMHTDLVDWIRQRDQEGDPIESIVDFGCGLGVGYCNDLADKHYTGVDMSRKNIEWCREHRNNPNHQYLCMDFVNGGLPEQADLVFSSGTLDNVYDVDVCLRNMVRNARKWTYVTFYRGWFPELREHKYYWSDEHKCFYNDVSPARLRETLLSMGCRDIHIRPARTERTDIPFETLVIARTPNTEC